eukprot:3473938-Lingulodinium_polyedra.AAC.1
MPRQDRQEQGVHLAHEQARVRDNGRGEVRVGPSQAESMTVAQLRLHLQGRQDLYESPNLAENPAALP